MSKVRLIVHGTISDYEAFADIAKRACAFVEEHEPGALAYECFASKETGQVVWHELYADEDAFLVHVQNFMSNGIVQETMKYVDMQPPTILTRIRDPRVSEVAAQFGAARLHGLAGLVR